MPFNKNDKFLDVVDHVFNPHTQATVTGSFAMSLRLS